MNYLVFCQERDPRIDPTALTANALRFFSARLAVLEEVGSLLRLELRVPPDPATGCFALRARRVVPLDLVAAREAEIRGRAGGMAMLAERCPTIWQIAPDPDATERLLFLICGICASVALGPVLPPDHGTLFGVRGAIERASRAHQKMPH